MAKPQKRLAIVPTTANPRSTPGYATHSDFGSEFPAGCRSSDSGGKVCNRWPKSPFNRWL